MDSRLKQRLIGAAVLIALAVIFLPMLIKEPAPDSGVSDMSLDVPQPPAGLGTIDLPLLTDSAPTPVESALPEGSSQEQASDTDATQETASTAPVTQDSETDTLLPASVASGQYVVHYATFATQSEADEMARQLQARQLPALTQATTFNGRPAVSVRIGPYADRAAAETARVRAAQVRGDVRPLVLVLDADEEAGTEQATSVSEPASSSRSTAQTATSTQTASPAPAAPATSTGRPTTTAPMRSSSSRQTHSATSPTAAAGFVVQVGAFSDAARAHALEHRLGAANIPVFTDTVNTRRGRLTRVNAGPVSSRTEAERLKTQVKSAVGTDGVIRRHP